MKKLKMDLNGIGELLSKEQMKMVTGGDGYSNYITCYYSHYILNPQDIQFVAFGYPGVDEAYCDSFCEANKPADTIGVDYWDYKTCSIF